MRGNWGDTNVQYFAIVDGRARGQSPTQCSNAFNLHCYQLKGHSTFDWRKYSSMGPNGYYSSSIFRRVIYTDIDIIHTVWSSYYSFRRGM